MPVLHEPQRESDLVKWDRMPNVAHACVRLVGGRDYAAGSVLGRVTATESYTLSPATGSDGSEIAAAVLTAPVDATAGDRDASAITRGPALLGRRALAFHPSVSDEVAIAGKLAQLRTLGIVARDQSPALGGAEIELLEGVALYGDSFAEGSSGGGAESAYTAFRPTLARYLAAAGLPGEVTNHAVSGETSAQALARWATRSTSRAYSVFWAGRNNPADPAAVIADAAAAVATLRPGQVLILVSVHNRNVGTEGSGSASYDRIATINAGLAALANGATVLFVDTRAEAVFAGIIGDAADGAAEAADCPAPSLTADGLHLNALGCDIAARLIFWAIYEHWLGANPRPNVVTNGDFASGTSGWTASNGAVLSAEDGALVVSADDGSEWKAAGQDFTVDAPGRYLLAFDVLDQAAASWAARLVQSTAGGSPLPVVAGFGNPIEFGYGAGFEAPAAHLARRRGHRLTTFAETPVAELGVQFAASNDAGMGVRLGAVTVHRVGVSEE